MVLEFVSEIESKGYDSFAEDRPTGEQGLVHIGKEYSTGQDLNPVEKFEHNWDYQGTTSRGTIFEYNGNIAYFDDSDYKLLDATDGSVISQTSLNLGSALEDASKVPGEDRVLIASNDHNSFSDSSGVAVFDLVDEVYDTFFACSFTTTPRATVTDGLYIVINDGEQFEAFDFGGTQQWTTTSAESPYSGTATYYGGQTYHAGSFGGMVSIDIDTGSIVWEDVDLEGDPFHASDGALFLNDSAAGELVEVNPNDGSIITRYSIGNVVSAERINDRILVYNHTSNAAGIRIFNYNTEELLFSGGNEINSSIDSSSIISNTVPYNGSFYIHIAGIPFDSDGTAHRFRMVEGVTAPQLYANNEWKTLP